MHQEINSPDIGKVYAYVFRPVKSQMCTLYKHISLKLMYGKVDQFALMNENVHRRTHALTGLMFAPSVIMFS